MQECKRMSWKLKEADGITNQFLCCQQGLVHDSTEPEQFELLPVVFVWNRKTRQVLKSWCLPRHLIPYKSRASLTLFDARQFRITTLTVVPVWQEGKFQQALGMRRCYGYINRGVFRFSRCVRVQCMPWFPSAGNAAPPAQGSSWTSPHVLSSSSTGSRPSGQSLAI